MMSKVTGRRRPSCDGGINLKRAMLRRSSALKGGQVYNLNQKPPTLPTIIGLVWWIISFSPFKGL